ncbi:MAG: TlpA disulfide reductase family protein [Balneolaceae bacterium]
MRLDPKYFNLFLVVCGALTLIVIVFGTIMYVSNQQETFQENLDETNLSEHFFMEYASDDSLSISQFSGEPVVIHFWSTWSGKSMEINEVLNEFKSENEDLIVIAAAARDGEELILEYMNEHSLPFYFVNGTDIYLDLLVPGLPSQIFISRNGEVVNTQVGADVEELLQKLRALVSDNE